LGYWGIENLTLTFFHSSTSLPHHLSTPLPTSTPQFKIDRLVDLRLAIALGDPIGAPEDCLEAIRGFQEFCDRNDWHPAFYQNLVTLPDVVVALVRVDSGDRAFDYFKPGA
jgi:hypothetical protein